MKKLLLITVVFIMAIAMTGCATSSAAPVELPPVPEGAERILLENGAYAIYKFELPDGAVWADYHKITAEYMVDAANITKRIRNTNNVRLMGNYNESDIPSSSVERIINLESHNGPYIMDNAPRTWESMGAAANEWFTVEYNITGSTAHAQFNRSNIPAPDATGPFFFGIGLTSQDAGRRNGITQFIRNVTLHHVSDPALNVVSAGSGFDARTFASFYPVLSTRTGGQSADAE
ncbi:MAG: hypothetical protein FWD13_04680 [Treponema sp.]|nr:hypothetical protein [Treponema sp.]